MLFAVLALAACKSNQAAGDKDAAPEQLYDEQQRAEKDEKFGEELVYATIRVDERGLTYNGKALAPPGAVPAAVAADGALVKRLRADNDHWYNIHRNRVLAGAEVLKGRADVAFTPDTPAETVAGVLASLREAQNKPRSVRVGEVPFEQEPPPVEPDEPPKAPVNDFLWLLRPTPGGYNLGVVGDGQCLATRRARDVSTFAEALAAIEEACPAEARCPRDVFVGGRAGQTALDLREQTRALRASPALRGGRVMYREPKPLPKLDCPPAAPPPAAGSAVAALAKKPPANAKGQREVTAPGVNIRAIKVNGALEPGRVERVVASASDAVHACFKKATEAQSQLVSFHGRIELFVNKRGEVAGARDLDEGNRGDTLSRCVNDTLGQLRFPEPSDGGVATIVVPIDIAY